MEHLGPGLGRDKSPEAIAEDIMNQSDEGVDDLLEGTEITEGENAEPDYEDEDATVDLFGDAVDGPDEGDLD